MARVLLVPPYCCATCGIPYEQFRIPEDAKHPRGLVRFEHAHNFLDCKNDMDVFFVPITHFMIDISGIKL